MTLMNLKELPKLRDSLSYVFFEHARIEKEGNAIAVFDKSGETHVPAAALGVLMLGPGTTITHAAMRVLAQSGCSVLWVGEDGVRMYAQGLGETRSSRRLLKQADLHADPMARAAVVYKMYLKRFHEPLPPGLSIQQLRGHEGVRVRTAYSQASRESGVPWTGRNYQRGDWSKADKINRAISSASSCLYGICHCAVISAGYSPSLGFIHTGKQLSFVYDMADLYKADTTIPVAFDVTGEYQRDRKNEGFEREIRRRCRETFRQHKILERIVKDIDDVLRVDQAAIEQSSNLYDGTDDHPGGLWDPVTGEVIGGVNYGALHPGKSPEEPKG
jgi:CRISPR-associated protein Cas1